MDDPNSPEQFNASSSNLNVNVRTKVNEWVSNFVTEMRSKSPAVVQKWVDSVPTSSAIKNVHDETTEGEESTESRSDENTTEKYKIQINELKRSPNKISSNENTTTLTSIKISVNSPNIPDKITDEDHFSNTKSQDEIKTDHSQSTVNATKFWQKRPTLLSAFGKSSFDKFYPRGEKSFEKTASPTDSRKEAEAQTDRVEHNFRSLGKLKINEFYNKLSISRNKYNLIRVRTMDAKTAIDQAKERLSTSKPLITAEGDESTGDSMTTLKVCDNVDMDLSLDEFSHMSRSNDNLSDSLTMSTQSIDEGPSPSQHLNISRKIAIGEIGRSTSDNPRLRNKFNLGDIGRSFSENQDDEGIMIGERNISAPSSSIAIENNNRNHPNYFERRAFSVSPTQSNIRRGILFRDQSLNEGSTRTNTLNRESSVQSDSSRCSSVESLLDARRPDSEAILRHLGFGPVQQEDLLSRIPKRFLKPSQVRGIDTDAFLRQQQIASNIHEQSILGYRGLVGNPHVPPSMIVAKLMERFQLNNGKSNKILDVINSNRPSSAPPTPGPNSSDSQDLS